jgi:hypothetical protein
MIPKFENSNSRTWSEYIHTRVYCHLSVHEHVNRNTQHTSRLLIKIYLDISMPGTSIFEIKRHGSNIFMPGYTSGYTYMSVYIQRLKVHQCC